MPQSAKEVLLKSVDLLLQIYQQWNEDANAPEGWLHPQNVYTPQFSDAIDDCVKIVHRGGIPSACLNLSRAITELHEEWIAYSENTDYRTSDGQPRASFRSALRELEATRKGAVIPKPVAPPPVKELIDQGVSPNQIAMYIYAHKGRGPFLDDNGAPRFDLIQKEAEKPGSVLKTKEWIHPDVVVEYKQKIGDVTTELVNEPDPEPPTADELEMTQLELDEAVKAIYEAKPDKSASDWLADLRENHSELSKGVNVADVTKIVAGLKKAALETGAQ